MRGEKLEVRSKKPILIKFQLKPRIDSLQSGIVYMNELKFFRDMEKLERDDDIGDLMENNIHSTAYELPDGRPSNVNLTENSSSNFVFCLFYVPLHLKHFQFSEKQKEKLPVFGDTALIIHDSQEFLNRVLCEAKKGGYKLHHRGVVLYNENEPIPMEVMDVLTKGLHNIAFMKREKYHYQQEYRLVINMDKTEKDHIRLNIGDISDISFQVSTKQILEEGIEIIE